MLDLTLKAPQRIKLLASDFDVAPLAAALERHPELWNEHRARTESPASPHHQIDDIWGRFCAAGENGGEPHFSLWYPAADKLPLRDMARDLMWETGGTVLGGVLVTRIPAGAQVLPHVDRGWHARFYAKVAVQIAADPGQAYCFEGESLVTKPGDVFTFDNAFSHWVTNPTPHARITAIFCIRVEP